MRTAILTLLCFVASGYATNAQKFTLLPQVGFENSKTSISYNDLRSFSPTGIKFSPQASLRLNYSSKQGHGFFIGAASSRSLVSFSFSDPETGMNNFTATTGNMQLRFEGGYQFNSKPISLNRSNQSKAKKESTKSSCGSYSKSNCSKSYSSSSRCGNSNKTKQPVLSKAKNSWVRIQPSVGMSFLPTGKDDVVAKTQNGQTTYQYNAGNWNTAVVTGVGFEFGKGRTRQLTASINYVRAIGNLDEQTVTSNTGVKSSTAILDSKSSAWSLKVGIPFSLGSNDKTKHKKKPQQKSGCGQYRIIYRCTN